MGRRGGIGRTWWAGVALAWGLVGVLGFLSFAGNTYLNDIPNVSVSEPDCYSFTITVDQASGSSATLTLRVHDVDEEAGELDTVYLNGQFLGYLSGTDGMWSTTSFDVSSVVIYGGDNTVQICIDPEGGETNTWVAEIDWGQILIDGGSAEDAEILSVDATGEWNAISVSTSVQASSSDTFRLEINLLDSTGNNKDIAVDTFAMTSGSTTTRTHTVSLPSEPTATETFTIEANLFNDTTGVQQNVKTTTWTYSASQPPSAADDAGSVVEGGSLILDVLANDIDPDGDSLSVSDVGPAAQGTAVLLPNDTIEYTPDLGACGTDTFTYVADDGNGGTDSATVQISIDNVPPTADPDTAETQEETAVLVSVLDNDVDPSGDLTIVSVDTPAHGTARIVGDHVEYTPQSRFEGTERFTYTLSDPCGATATAEITIEVLHTNHPPIARVDGLIQGTAGIPIELNAAGSSDPDTGDRLEFRWDLDGDGRFDTTWSADPTYLAIYDSGFVGEVVLEVRDLYRGLPTGAVSRATAVVQIGSVQSITLVVFEDLDGDGLQGEGEAGVPGVDILLQASAFTTGSDGRITFGSEPGSWEFVMAPESIEALETRDYTVQTAEQQIDLAPGDEAEVFFSVRKIAGRLEGRVYIDRNEDGVLDDEDDLVKGLEVVLDGDEEGAVLTDDHGAFVFDRVLFGDHTLVVRFPNTNEEGVESGGEDTASFLEIPLVHARLRDGELWIAWPWDVEASETGSGFLNVDVEANAGE